MEQQQQCTVVRGRDHNLYLLSDRFDNIRDGAYALDETGESFLLFHKEWLPVEFTNLTPIGTLRRIEASTNTRLESLRFTEEFLNTYVAYQKQSANYYIKINRKSDRPKNNGIGHVMLKVVNNSKRL